MNEAVLAIAVADIRPACKDEPDLIERIKKAMRKAQHFFMSTDDDLRLKGALGAALLESSGEQKAALETSIRSLSRVSAVMHALQAGVPVDLEAMAKEQEGEPDPLPLMAWWHEAVADAR